MYGLAQDPLEATWRFSDVLAYVKLLGTRMRLRVKPPVAALGLSLMCLPYTRDRRLDLHVEALESDMETPNNSFFCVALSSSSLFGQTSAQLRLIIAALSNRSCYIVTLIASKPQS